MGKYMKKSKLTGGIAVMDVSPESSPVFRTRAAKTLALQRLNKSFSQSAVVSSPRSASSSSYLQLRSRRLEKPPTLRLPPKALQDGKCSRGAVNLECASNGSDLENRKFRVETESGNVRDFEVCVEEKCLGFGGEIWGTEEKMHTSHSRMETNSHTTNAGVEMELLKSIPTANDIEEFFAHEELWHQRAFTQKYNFNFASEMPLQGRYEWVQVVP